MWRVFVLLVGGGAALLLLDRPIGAVAHTIERIHNMLLRRRPKMTGLGERLTTARDAVRATLGEQWGQAILRSAGNVLFDYLALLAALVASGSRPTASLVLLAYVASVVLGMIPITPGGLGFVEAGLAAMLVLAGVPGPSATLATLAYRLGVVLGTDPRRPGRVRAVPTPGSAVAGGGARPGRYLRAAEPTGASSCSCGAAAGGGRAGPRASAPSRDGVPPRVPRFHAGR